MNFEVLGNEWLMLENNLLLFVFFCFLGLVFDNSVVIWIMVYGLIFIGSDVWLVKGEVVELGSIVFIYGNGNEFVGVEDFFWLF